MKAEDYKTLATEDEFKDTVIDLAHHYGWLVHHDRPARTSTGWATAIQGDKGFPDLVLVKQDAPIIFAELKKHGGKPTDAQRAWLQALTNLGRRQVIVTIWQPSDMDDIKEMLSGRE